MRPIFTTVLGLTVLIASPTLASSAAEVLSPEISVLETAAPTGSAEPSTEAIEGQDNGDAAPPDFLERIRIASQAEKKWRMVIQLNPKNAQAYLNLANALKDLSREQEAEALYRRSIELDPRNEAAYQALSRFLQIRLRFSEAANLYEQMTVAMPKNANAYAGLAFSLELSPNEDSYRETEAAYRKAISLDSNEADYYRSFATYLIGQQRPAEAIALLQEAVRLEPDRLSTYQTLAAIVQETEGIAAAQAVYEAAIANQPENIGTYTLYANWLLERDRPQEGETVYRRALKQLPDSAEPYAAFGRYLTSIEQLEKAIALYQEAIDLGIKDERLYVQMGDVLSKTGQKTAAKAAYEAAIPRSSKGSAYSRLGNLLEETGQTDEALRLFQQAIQIFPEDSHFYYQLGNLLRSLGRVDEAIATYRSAITFDNGAANTEALAMLLVEQKQYAAAIDLYERFGLNFGNDQKTIENWQTALRGLGRAAEADSLPQAIQIKLAADAEASYREAIALSPESGYYHYLLATSLDTQGKAAEAEIAYQKALRYNYNPVETNLKLGKLRFKQGQFDLAEAAYQQALKQYDPASRPFDAGYLDQVYRNLGDLYQATERLSLALEFYQKSLELNPYQTDIEEAIDGLRTRLATGKSVTEATADGILMNRLNRKLGIGYNRE